MQFLPNGWHIPHSLQQCQALNVSVTCDFALYSNATGLTEDQKLAPNTDITGKLIFSSFIVTAVTSLVLSCILCLDKFLFRWTQGRPHEVQSHRHYLKAVHMIETLLHTFSDQQLVAAVSLLFVLNDQSCTISAYDFNLACTMLLISVVVHLNALIMISDFIFKGKTLALSRIASIAMQLILTGIVFSARNTAMFPFEPQSLAIMPAACFENNNATSAAGLGDFINLVSNVTTNATLTATNTTGTDGTNTIWANIEAATSKTHGLVEYSVLVIFVILAAITLLAEWIGSETGWNKHIGWASVVVSFTSTAASVGLVGYSFSRYNILTSGMKVDDWYQLATVEPLTLSQLLPLALLGSSIFPIINAIRGSLPLKSRRFSSILGIVETGLKLGASETNKYEPVYNSQYNGYGDS